MTIDPRTVAADIMTDYARDVGNLDIAAYIGQAYDDTDITEENVKAIADLIAKAGIDLIWPDGTQNTELDAARVEVERLRQQVDSLSTMFGDAQDRLTEARAELAKVREVVEAAKAWRGMRSESANVRPKPEAAALIAAVDALPKAATV